MKSSKKSANKKHLAWVIVAIILAATVLALNFWLLGRQDSSNPVVALGEDFTLKPGQQVILKDLNGSTLKLHHIEDSSCPEDVQCFWQGQIYYYLVFDDQSIVVGSVLPNDTTRPLREDYTIHYVSGDISSGTFVLQKAEK